MSELGTPFVLEGLFGEADAEAMDAEPDLDPAADSMSMDVEDDAEATADGGMIVDDDEDGAKNKASVGSLYVFRTFSPVCEAVKKVYRTAELYHIPDLTNADANANAQGRPPQISRLSLTPRWHGCRSVCAASPCAPRPSQSRRLLCVIGARSGRRGGSASGRCSIGALETLSGCTLRVDD